MTQTDIEIRIMESLGETPSINTFIINKINDVCFSFGISKKSIADGRKQGYTSCVRGVLSNYFINTKEMPSEIVHKHLGINKLACKQAAKIYKQRIEDKNLTDSEELIHKFLTSGSKVYNYLTMMEDAANYMGLDYSVYKSKSRMTSIIILKRVVVYFLREKHSFSFSHIGKILGYSDHLTPLHHYNLIKDNIRFRSKTEQNLYKQIINRYEQYN